MATIYMKRKGQKGIVLDSEKYKKFCDDFDSGKICLTAKGRDPKTGEVTAKFSNKTDLQ